MYLWSTKTVIAEALRQVFTANYPLTDFQNLHISLEYPLQAQDYPGVWVDFEQVGNLTRGSVDSLYSVNPDGTYYPNDIWRFKGYALYTIGAMTSLQRDRLFDELSRVFAFSVNDLGVYPFRAYIESNPYVALNMDFDDIMVTGMAVGPTPWGDETKLVYEVTLGMECVGEFADERIVTTTPPIPALQDLVITGTVPGQYGQAPFEQSLTSSSALIFATPATSSGHAVTSVATASNT